MDGLLNDFNRELSAYLDDMTFDEGEFYETERRLDLINGLKANMDVRSKIYSPIVNFKKKNWKNYVNMRKIYRN